VPGNREPTRCKMIRQNTHTNCTLSTKERRHSVGKKKKRSQRKSDVLPPQKQQKKQGKYTGPKKASREPSRPRTGGGWGNSRGGRRGKKQKAHDQNSVKGAQVWGESVYQKMTNPGAVRNYGSLGPEKGGGRKKTGKQTGTMASST